MGVVFIVDLSYSYLKNQKFVVSMKNNFAI